MNSLELGLLLPAFLAGLLVLATHIPFGMEVLKRGVIFADLAVAQIAGLGVISAEWMGVLDQPLLVQLIAASGALCGALLLTWIERTLPEVKEAAIGLSFVLAASGGILLLSRDQHAGEHLQDLLAGQILWATPAQLAVTAIVSAALLLAWRLMRDRLGNLGFYLLFALAVTASVQLVGVYLVFASLIVPALATCKLHQGRLPAAFGIGLAGYASGLLASVWFDLPAGAAIVWTMTLCGAVAFAGLRRE